MGCLNSTGAFSHWFGNIHLSGPCNRSCYFCIGQHMMDLDALNVLNTWPLKGLPNFVERCISHRISEINLTGTNTDPMLYQHIIPLADFLRFKMPTVRFGIRTNGITIPSRPSQWKMFDKASISLCSTDLDVNVSMMGGPSPDLRRIVESSTHLRSLKVNIVLGPENCRNSASDLLSTLKTLASFGITRVNLREPYGQPKIGDPLAWKENPVEIRLGMPVYQLHGMEVTYWDVHYVEVESVNLYASGKVSETYPITRGHSDNGTVLAQSYFPRSGRVREQWVNIAVT